jgi:hypothetical protein
MAVVVVIASAAAWYLRWRPSHAPVAPAAASSATTGPSSTPRAAAKTESPPARRPAHATPISPEARRQIADRIAAARVARPASPASAAASMPRPPPDQARSDDDTDAIKTPARAAIRETIPLVRACLEKAHVSMAARVHVQGKLVLTGDPDVGTLIDADQLTDEHGQPLSTELDSCIRGELQGIELPPLREGNKMRLTYMYEFSGDDQRHDE